MIVTSIDIVIDRLPAGVFALLTREEPDLAKGYEVLPVDQRASSPGLATCGRQVSLDSERLRPLGGPIGTSKKLSVYQAKNMSAVTSDPGYGPE